MRGDRLFVAFVAGDGAVEHQPQAHARCVGNDLARLVGFVLGRDEHLRRAVVEDVAQLMAGEAAGAGGVHEAGVVAAPDDLEVAVVILHADGDMVTGLQAGGAQQMAQPVGRRIEFGEGLGEARAAHHDGDFVGLGFKERTGEHGGRR